ncbi:hypothetical protein CBM2600_A10114 [Cupriavidus taiwanensis]|nr:hypothetical protein CBM2600_A10114 [Cupriavidus taiwanensis]
MKSRDPARVHGFLFLEAAEGVTQGCHTRRLCG